MTMDVLHITTGTLHSPGWTETCTLSEDIFTLPYPQLPLPSGLVLLGDISTLEEEPP